MEVNTVLRNRWGHIIFYLQDNVGKHLLVSGDFSSDFPNRNSYLALATLWECADAVLAQTNVSACSESETKASLQYTWTNNNYPRNKKNQNTIGIHDFSSEPQTKHSVHMTCTGKIRTDEKTAVTVEQGHGKLLSKWLAPEEWHQRLTPGFRIQTHKHVSTLTGFTCTHKQKVYVTF